MAQRLGARQVARRQRLRDRFGHPAVGAGEVADELAEQVDIAVQPAQRVVQVDARQRIRQTAGRGR